MQIDFMFYQLKKKNLFDVKVSKIPKIFLNWNFITIIFRNNVGANDVIKN